MNSSFTSDEEESRAQLLEEDDALSAESASQQDQHGARNNGGAELRNLMERSNQRGTNSPYVNTLLDEHHEYSAARMKLHPPLTFLPGRRALVTLPSSAG